MTINVVNGLAATAGAANARQVDGAEKSADGSGVSQIASAKHELNVQILQASAAVSLSAGNDSQALLFRTAIDRLNELLGPTQGGNAIESAALGQDNSPEATAERILGFSTAFFDAYARQHPGKDPDQLAKDFVDLIRGGFEKGFGEARGILEGLGVFGGDTESGIMKTYALVQKGYDDFLASKLTPSTTEDAATAKENTGVSP